MKTRLRHRKKLLAIIEGTYGTSPISCKTDGLLCYSPLEMISCKKSTSIQEKGSFSCKKYHYLAGCMQGACKIMIIFAVSYKMQEVLFLARMCKSCKKSFPLGRFSTILHNWSTIPCTAIIWLHSKHGTLNQIENWLQFAKVFFAKLATVLTGQFFAAQVFFCTVRDFNRN